MLNLEEKIGLKVLLKDDNTLDIDPDVEVEAVSSRKFIDLKPVVADDGVKLSEDPAYFMYRNVRLPSDEEVLRSNNLRFDLTVIPSAKIGDEFVKTSGHYHPAKAGTEIAYPELYYVAAGQATYLMQKRGVAGNVEDVILCRVGAGKAIVMPPGYGHVTINELDETLVMANWVSNGFQSIYGDYEELRGGSHYLFKSGNRTSVQKNERYSAPNYVEFSTFPIILNDLKDVPIYAYINNPRKLEFLDKPESHFSELTKEALFKRI